MSPWVPSISNANSESEILLDSTKMDRGKFLDHLVSASELCRAFTSGFVSDSLPASSRFFVLLNSSYDGNPLRDGEVVFPDDVQKYGNRVGPLKADEVVSLLWRDGMIPEWIDISVYGADQQCTCFQLMCCGRFTSQNRFLYYTWTDVPPFGVKGPTYPKRLAMTALDGKPVPKFTLAESRQDHSQ